MAVFKIDVEKNIIYVKGSLPGKAGTVLKIWDTLLLDKSEDNLRLSHFPTFVEKEGVTYAKQFSMYCGERDPSEIEIHDNAYIVDDGEEEEKE
jgi:large subunit ribosomal protein L3